MKSHDMKSLVIAVTLIITLVASHLIAQDTSKTFFNSQAAAETTIATINRSISKVLSSTKSSRAKTSELQKINEQHNKELAGKTITWTVQFGKAVVETEKHGEMIVPEWIQGATVKTLTLGGNSLSKYPIKAFQLQGEWPKTMNKGDYATLTATVKEVVFDGRKGAVVVLSGGSLTPAKVEAVKK